MTAEQFLYYFAGVAAASDLNGAPDYLGRAPDKRPTEETWVALREAAARAVKQGGAGNYSLAREVEVPPGLLPKVVEPEPPPSLTEAVAGARPFVTPETIDHDGRGQPDAVVATSTNESLEF